MGGAGTDHGTGRDRTWRGYSQNGYGRGLGRCLDEHDSAFLGVAVASDCRAKGERYNGILCDGIIMEFCRDYGRVFRCAIFLNPSRSCGTLTKVRRNGRKEV